jgi:hypothetical protein
MSGKEEVVILHVEDPHAVLEIELLHLSDHILHGADSELPPASLLIPGVDAAKGAVTPTSPARQEAGDGFSK